MYAGCKWLTVEEERMRRMAGSGLGPDSVVGFRLSRMGKARCGGLWGSLELLSYILLLSVRIAVGILCL